MAIPVLSFFNTIGGVGKTSLVYHLAWMYARLGKRILAVDFDPQAKLTSFFLTEDEIEDLWYSRNQGSTVYQCVKALAGDGGMVEPNPRVISQDLYFMPGDVLLSSYEAVFATEWAAGGACSLRTLSAFWQVAQNAGEMVGADIILTDMGANLGAINHSILVSADYIAIPLGSDIFSLRGLWNLGVTLETWRGTWKKMLADRNRGRKKVGAVLALPGGAMHPIGYLCRQPPVRYSDPNPIRDKWVRQMPGVYRETVLGEEPVGEMSPEDDPHCLGVIKHHRSLVPMGRECRKPMFNLTPADGAIGIHAAAVQEATRNFRSLAGRIARRMDIGMERGN
ncbi:MAG: ParA family protein [Planctomycetota bacterium]|nr:ParA family protein [Planctomycetota bacterium]